MAKRGRPRKVKFELESDSVHSIAAITLLLAALLTSLSFFGQAAGFGSLLQQILNKFFGWGVVFIPPILVLSGIILLKKPRWSVAQPRVLSGLVLFWISFLGFSHFFFPSGTAGDEAVMGQGGGVLGFELQKLLRKALGPFGAFSVLLASLLIALLVIFNASLDESLVFVAKISGAVGAFFEKYLFRNTIGFLRRLRGKEEKDVVENAGTESVAPEKTLEVSEEKEVPRKDTVEVVRSTYAPSGVREEEEEEKKKAAGLRYETVANIPARTIAWRYPPLDLFHDLPTHEPDQEALARDAQVIEDSLESFGIRAKVAEVNVGPAVTQFALEAASGTKLAKITTLQRDLAMAVASSTGSVRIEAPIPGKSLIGIEVPNRTFSMVSLKSTLVSKQMKEAKSPLTVSLGKDVSGKPLVADLARMPHILVAGATGSGKSVLIHTFISSIIFRTTPEEVRLILADPKRVELSIYGGIPHLLAPVIVDIDKMLPTLKWAASEMERRYRLFQNAGAKDIDSYNELSGFQALPYIVIVIDELADIMALSANEVEKAIVRLAQMSRATGIHLVLSTQRPSTDVLTGLIKANIPCRIALNTTSGVDSRVILDQPGADKLLGRGDMLYLPPEASKPRRIQGAFVSLAEIKKLVGFLKKENVREPEFEETLAQAQRVLGSSPGYPHITGGADISGESARSAGSDDELFPEAVEIVCRHERGSASLLQRRLSIGYARAARLLDDLEARGVVGPKDGAKPRQVLISDPLEIL